MLLNRLVLATHNTGKVAEIKQVLGALVGEVKIAADFGLTAPAETGNTFLANATLKARYVADATGLPALADDSGLMVTALGGAPGVHTADWAEKPDGSRDYAQAFARLEQGLADKTDLGAAFISVLVLAWPDGKLLAAEGKVAGQICLPPRGSQGFGYDPVFVPEGYTQTFAEMPAAEKNQLSHRGRALAVLRAQLIAA